MPEYEPEGRYCAVPVDSELGLWRCLECGCLVVDRPTHDGWHYWNEVGGDEGG